MRRTPPPAPAPAGVYLHFPFCAIRCTYCDFPTVAGRDERIRDYLGALVEEIASYQPDVPREVDSIFLGGGTPSRMTPEQVARVLGAVGRRFDVAAGCEVTLESNPESLDPGVLAGFVAAGVNRISIGVQSLDDAVLASVGRAHDAARAVRAVERARAAGFASVSVDLIAGLPGERLEGWRGTLDRVVALEPDHVSVYLLETDKDTPLARSLRHGRVRVADDDALAAAYEDTVERLAGRGYEPYEISNFARTRHASRHNLKYWSDVPYAGFGLGAHGYAAGARRANERMLDDYLDHLRAGRDPVAERDPWDGRRRLEEAMMLGLRRTDGVDLARLGRRYDADVGGDYAGVWDEALATGLIRREGSRVRLTPAGRLRSNEVFRELLTA